MFNHSFVSLSFLQDVCWNMLSMMLLLLLFFQGSQDQLKEVWEEADGLDPDDFDPKTFFNLHGNTFYLFIYFHQTFPSRLTSHFNVE